jgi:hypothetical protein
MMDSNGILEGDGVKMRNIKIFQDSNIDNGLLTDFIKEASMLNNKLGNPSR